MEQTVTGNARLEQELLVLRQKLQETRGSRDMDNSFGMDNAPYTGGNTAVLESGKQGLQIDRLTFFSLINDF